MKTYAQITKKQGNSYTKIPQTQNKIKISRNKSKIRYKRKETPHKIRSKTPATNNMRTQHFFEIYTVQKPHKNTKQKWKIYKKYKKSKTKNKQTKIIRKNCSSKQPAYQQNKYTINTKPWKNTKNINKSIVHWVVSHCYQYIIQIYRYNEAILILDLPCQIIILII